MKYEVVFAMCHCETALVELEPEEIKGLSEREINDLIEEKGRDIISTQSSFDIEDIIEICEVD
jgi:hypothetical protein